MNKITVRIASAPRIVRITHSQSIKQSLNYQAAEANFGVTVECDGTFLGVKKARALAVRFVETALNKKFHQQNTLLIRLAKDRQ